MHIDPGLYLYEFGSHGLAQMQEALQRTASAVSTAGADGAVNVTLGKDKTPQTNAG